jgi:hypothetical protein
MNGTAVRVSPKLLIGVLALSLGILWTLDSFDLIDSDRYTRWWPAVLIIAGLIRLLDPHAGKVASVVMVLAGGLLLGDNLRLFDLDPGQLIPLGLVLLGAKLMWDSFARTRAMPVSEDPSAEIHAVAVMAGVKRQTTSQEFRGGDASAVMGGVEIDLRNAKIADGAEAVIDTFAWWGGVEITVPPNWRVVGKVFPLMGAFEDKTVSGTGPTLYITGMAIMGGVEVKN